MEFGNDPTKVEEEVKDDKSSSSQASYKEIIKNSVLSRLQLDDYTSALSPDQPMGSIYNDSQEDEQLHVEHYANTWHDPVRL